MPHFTRYLVPIASHSFPSTPFTAKRIFVHSPPTTPLFKSHIAPLTFGILRQKPRRPKPPPHHSKIICKMSEGQLQKVNLQSNDGQSIEVGMSPFSTFLLALYPAIPWCFADLRYLIRSRRRMPFSFDQGPDRRFGRGDGRFHTDSDSERQ